MSEPKPLSPGCAISLYGFGILCGIGMAIGGLALLGQLPSAYAAMQEKWTEAPGTILASRTQSYSTVTGNQHKHHSEQYFVELEYKYTAASKAYQGKASAAEQPSVKGSKEQADAITAEYKVGAAVPVYFKPEDPAQSRLDESGANGMFWIGVITGPLLIACGLGLAWWCRSDYKRQKLASSPSA